MIKCCGHGITKKYLKELAIIEREGEGMNFELTIKEYPKEAEKLVEIWKKASTLGGLGFVTFVHKRPKNPKTKNRRILGLKAECVSYLREDEELVKMTVENYIYLMAKCGVEFETKEVKE